MPGAMNRHTPPVSDRKSRRTSAERAATISASTASGAAKWGKLLLWPTGVDLPQLDDTHGRRRYLAAGALVYLTAFAAFAGMTIAQIVIFGPWRPSYLIASTAWALVVFSIDTWITSTIDYGPLEPEETDQGAKFRAFAGRLLLSTVIGILIAEPILLLAFDQEVKVAVREIHNAQAVGVSDRVSNRAEFERRRSDIERAFGVGDRIDPASATAKQKDAHTKANNAYTAWQCEYVGTCGTYTQGYGPEERKLYRIYEEAVHARDEADGAFEKAQGIYNADKARLDQDIQDKVHEDIATIDGNWGLLIREQALEDVESGSWRAMIGAWLLRGALMLMDLMPLLIKTFSARSPYERKIRAMTIAAYYGIEAQAREKAEHRMAMARIGYRTELADAEHRHRVAEAAAEAVAAATARETKKVTTAHVGALTDSHLTHALHRLAPRFSGSSVPHRADHVASASAEMPLLRNPQPPPPGPVPEPEPEEPAMRTEPHDPPEPEPPHLTRPSLTKHSKTPRKFDETDLSNWLISHGDQLQLFPARQVSNGFDAEDYVEESKQPDAQGEDGAQEEHNPTPFPFLLGKRWWVQGHLQPDAQQNKSDSTLYLAHDDLGEYQGEYVVKLLHNVIDSHGNPVGAALKEAEFRGFEHKNWAKIYDAKAERTDFFLVTRRYPATLLSLAQQRPLTLYETWDFADQLLRGLINAWRIPKIHLDIKPSNIAIDESNIVKIFDWGISKDPDASTGQTTGGPSYTAHYAPPEQIERSKNWVHANADLRALAATWYWMLTGIPPLQLEAIEAGVVTDKGRIGNEQDYVSFLRKTMPRPVRTLIPDIPPELDHVLAQWLDPIPKKRNPGKRGDYERRLTAQMDKLEEIINDRDIRHNLVGPAGIRDSQERASKRMSQEDEKQSRQQRALTPELPAKTKSSALPAREKPTRRSGQSENGSAGPAVSST
ncbi:DUF4407 domain-containing protein [Nocardia gamkensis]|uniref:DUF4407 domain-containing protein n=1 Tax=Nocardia gamkensis TaxID=352869 RepID=UPI0037C6E5DB